MTSSRRPIFNKTHVRKAAKMWKHTPGRGGFRDSLRYDVEIDGMLYPPKAIASIANELAGNGILKPGHFSGTREGKWHKELERLGFIIRLKGDAVINKEKEGEERLRVHKSRERNQKVVKRAKSKRLELTGKLECEACGFDFEHVYGDLGKNFIEAHHRIPVSTYKGKTSIDIKDFALVCSNCHRMIHMTNPLMTVEQFKKNIVNAKKMM